MYLGEVNKNCKMANAKRVIWLDSLKGVLIFSIYSTQGLPNQLMFISFIPSSILYYLYRILTACLAIFFLFSIGVKKMNEEQGLVQYAVALGKVSLGIYAVHMVVRFRLMDVIVFMIPGISYWPLMITVFIILVPLSYAIVWLLGKWKPTSTLLLGKLQ